MEERDAPCASSRSASVRPESCASRNASTSSITSSSSSPSSVSSSLESSSSRASSIANGVRSISAAAVAAAWNMLGIGDSSPAASVSVALSVDEGDVASAAGADGAPGDAGRACTGESVGLLVRLALDVEWRIVGVRSDSRALGSSSVVYLPIAGRVKTYT